MHNVPYINQVHLLYRSKLLDLDFSPGVESLEVALLSEAEIPWGEIAFRPVKFTLLRYFADRKKGCFQFFNSDLAPPVQKPDNHS
jgi:hypothetical protein